MSKFNLNIETESLEELLGLFAKSSSSGSGVFPGDTAPVVETKVPVQETSVTAPKKRGRKPAAEVPAGTLPATPAPTELEAEPKVPEETKTDTLADDEFGEFSDEPKITKQQLNDAFMVLGKKKGRPAIDAIIKYFGALKFSELKEEQYAKVMEMIQESLA